MIHSPLSVDVHTPICKSAALLRHHGLDAAPVVDDYRRPIGLVTASACAAWEEFTNRSAREIVSSTPPDWSTVNEILEPKLELVRSTTSSHEVIDAMVERGVRRVYVVDDADKLVGVISASDILRHLLHDEIHSPLKSQPGL